MWVVTQVNVNTKRYLNRWYITSRGEKKSHFILDNKNDKMEETHNKVILN